MRYFLIVDNYGLLSALPSLAPERDEVLLFTVGKGLTQQNRFANGLGNLRSHNISGISKFGLSSQDRVMIHVKSRRNLLSIVKRLRSISHGVPILLFDQPSDTGAKAQMEKLRGYGVGLFTIHEFLKTKANEKWHQIEIKKKVERMKKAIDPDLPLWILTQNDPDPDAIASAMALQAILGRNDKSAPIVTLKCVSRVENISMINILGIPVKKVRTTGLNRAVQIATVDVQPPFFGFAMPNIKVVIDHHPLVEDYEVAFRDLQVTYGSTSTILTEYLVASGIKINQRLGTALYYGIKTDTLLLGRSVSRSDFNAFTLLWPKANHHQISQMERPRLQSKELHVMVKALKEHTIERGCIFVGLGNVPKDDLVPRLADFVMQIGDTEFSLVWGIVNDEATFSTRSLSPLVHAGDVMRAIFSRIGSAGGHRTMARATMPLAVLTNAYKTRSVKKITEMVKKKVLRQISKQKREHSS